MKTYLLYKSENGIVQDSPRKSSSILFSRQNEKSRDFFFSPLLTLRSRRLPRKRRVGRHAIRTRPTAVSGCFTALRPIPLLTLVCSYTLFCSFVLFCLIAPRLVRLRDPLPKSGALRSSFRLFAGGSYHYMYQPRRYSRSETNLSLIFTKRFLSCSGIAIMSSFCSWMYSICD